MPTLQLIKGREIFRVTYEPGQEARVVDCLVEMANNPDLNFDLFDAAVMSHDLGMELLQKELKTPLRKP